MKSFQMVTTRGPVRRLTKIQQSCSHTCRKALNKKKGIIFGKKVLPGIFLGCVIAAGWKGDIVVADIEELEKMDASDIHARRLNAKEVLRPMRSEKFIVQVADGRKNFVGGSGTENTHLNPGSPRPRKRTRKSFQENQTGLHHHFKTHRGMMVKQETISGPFRELHLPSSR